MKIDELINEYENRKQLLNEIKWILIHGNVEEKNNEVVYHNILSRLYYKIKDKLNSVRITYHNNNERYDDVFFDKQLSKYFYEILIKRRDELLNEIQELENKIQ